MILSRNIYIIILTAFIVSSCTEKIDIQLDDSYTRLVVEGNFTTDTMAHTVLLTSTASYFYNQPPPPVSGATVSISDGTTTFNLTEATPGVYRTESNVYGIPGKTYRLNINLEKPIGGTTDYSASSTLYPVTPMDSINLLFHADWSRNGIWEVKCYVQEPPTIDFYRFLIYKNKVLLTDSLNEWLITDDKLFNGNYTNGLPIAYIDQGNKEQKLKPGDTITAEVNSIGKEYFNFLTEAQTELFGSNPLFSGPPANIQGNINNGAIGFFAAYSATRSYAIAPKIKK